MVEDFAHEVEKSLDKAAGSITPDTPLSGIPELDSLGRLSVMAMVDSIYHVTLAADMFDTCKTVRDLHVAVSTRKQA